jgi:trans-2,3-dihydro-3-hydroxyanthranilate isomerase
MTPPSEEYLRFFQVDTFSNVAFSGSPAGVFPDSGELSDDYMIKIARQLKTGETVFCTPSTGEECLASLTIVPAVHRKAMNGNAFLAAAHVLFGEDSSKTLPAGRNEIRFKTPDGIVSIRISGGPGPQVYFVDCGTPRSERASQYKVDLIRLLNVATSDYDPQFTIQKSTVLHVPIRRLHSLLTFQPNLPLISSFLQGRSIEGICVYSTETIERASAFHARYFSSRGGASEEPATGFVHAEVAAYLLEKGVLKSESGKCRVSTEQGDAMGRPSRMQVELVVGSEGVVEGTFVGGSAVTVARGEIRIPK